MRYNVTIKEVLARSLQVEADSVSDAESAVSRLYRNSDVVLSADDYAGTEIVVDNHQPYYKSPSNDFTLIQGDCVETLSKFKFGFDMVFADPPYFLSGGGISYQNGRIVCVDGGKCIFMLRGVRPFLSDKYDLIRHPNYRYTADADPKNVFDMERYMKKQRAVVKPTDTFDVYEIDATT